MLWTMSKTSVFVYCAIIVGVAGASDFCWKNTYTRGIGKIPDSCGANQVGIGLFCYDECPSGFRRFGFDCHSVCPSGFRDDGLFCRHTEYGRGVGYPWKFGDPLNDSKMWERCLHDHPEGCEKHLLIVYPKCAPGYWAFGCCICRPPVPDCPALGLNPGIDLSCAKKIMIGNPQIGTCSPGHELDAGLCYPQCRSGYYGVSFVCWSTTPPGWVGCGMGAAKSSTTCATTVLGQVSSVGQLTLSIATAGLATSSVKLLKAPADAKKLKKVKEAYNAIKDNENVKKAIVAYDSANKLKKGYVSIDTALQAQTEEDLVRLSALIASFTDPSGISGVVSAYTYPLCSKIFTDNQVSN